MPLKLPVTGRFRLLIVLLEAIEFPVFLNRKFVARLTDILSIWTGQTGSDTGKERSSGASYERPDQARVRDRTYSSSQATSILHRQIWHAHVWAEQVVFAHGKAT